MFQNKLQRLCVFHIFFTYECCIDSYMVFGGVSILWNLEVVEGYIFKFKSSASSMSSSKLLCASKSDQPTWAPHFLPTGISPYIRVIKFSEFIYLGSKELSGQENDTLTHIEAAKNTTFFSHQLPSKSH